MRISRFVCILAGLAAGLLLTIAAPRASAQMMGGALIFEPGASLNKQPYTATWAEKTVQTLSNGTTVTHESTTKFAHDSNGRTYSEMHRTVSAGSNGQPNEVVTYHIADTVAGTITSWDSNTKLAFVKHQPEQQPLRTQTAAAQGEAPAVQMGPVTGQQADAQRKDLGTKNIAGLNAKGTLVTRVIAAGRDGNDQPITTTQETWRSTEYGIVLMNVSEDPRYGTTTQEVTEFTPGEPDAALFHMPEGHTVREFTARTVPNQ